MLVHNCRFRCMKIKNKMENNILIHKSFNQCIYILHMHKAIYTYIKPLKFILYSYINKY